MGQRVKVRGREAPLADLALRIVSLQRIRLEQAKREQRQIAISALALEAKVEDARISVIAHNGAVLVELATKVQVGAEYFGLGMRIKRPHERIKILRQNAVTRA